MEEHLLWDSLKLPLPSAIAAFAAASLVSRLAAALFADWKAKLALEILVAA